MAFHDFDTPSGGGALHTQLGNPNKQPQQQFQQQQSPRHDDCLIVRAQQQAQGYGDECWTRIYARLVSQSQQSKHPSIR